jgi:hypothetical protein
MGWRGAELNFGGFVGQDKHGKGVAVKVEFDLVEPLEVIHDHEELGQCG